MLRRWYGVRIFIVDPDEPIQTPDMWMAEMRSVGRELRDEKTEGDGDAETRRVVLLAKLPGDHLYLPVSLDGVHLMQPFAFQQALGDDRE